MANKDFLGSLESSAGDSIKFLNKQIDSLSGQNSMEKNQTDQFKNDGFLLPATFSADGNGLPYTKVPSNKAGVLKRNIITWFIPEFGVVRMYVNPSQITYTNKKTITKDRTKGGYTLQYWGEELGTIALTGTTGSSGIEGINALYEIYRAEQYAFDATGLTLASHNAAADLATNAVNAVGGAVGSGIGGFFGGAGGAVGGALGAGLAEGLLGGTDSSISPQNITSLAQLAFTVEMYYNGVVYRGYFENMTVNEKASDFLIDYQMTFVTTQRRGYRTNYFPWSKSAKDGPSSYTTPSSYSGNAKVR